jgi:hypothetical protein
LKVVNCLSHVAFRGKYKGREAIVIVFDLRCATSGEVAVQRSVARSLSPQHRSPITVEGSRGLPVWHSGGWHIDSVSAR